MFDLNINIVVGFVSVWSVLLKNFRANWRTFMNIFINIMPLPETKPFNFLILYNQNSNMVVTRTSEVGAALAPLSVGFWNFVW